MYLSTRTRPDIAYVFGQLSSYVEDPTYPHLGAVKLLLQYLVGTKSQGIVYFARKNEDRTTVLHLDGYCDAYRVNHPETRKNVTGFVVNFSGGAVS